MCLSVTSHISETSEAIAIKFDTVTASVMRMHQVLIILTLTTTWHQSRPMERNHENNKCSVISQILQAIPFKFAVKIVLKVHNYSLFQSDDLDLKSYIFDNI